MKKLFVSSTCVIATSLFSSCGVGVEEPAAAESRGALASAVAPPINPFGPQYHFFCPRDMSISSSCVAATAQSDCNTHCAKAIGKGPPVCAKLAPTQSTECAP